MEEKKLFGKKISFIFLETAYFGQSIYGAHQHPFFLLALVRNDSSITVLAKLTCPVLVGSSWYFQFVTKHAEPQLLCKFAISEMPRFSKLKLGCIGIELSTPHFTTKRPLEFLQFQ